MGSVFQAQAVEFPSAYGLAESVARLKAATRRSVFSAMAGQAAVGRVSERRVSLQRSIPLVGNSFKPFFVGRFIERDGAVVLVGKYRMLWLVRGLLAVWFGGLAVAATSLALARASPAWAGVGACLGMIAAGVGVVRLGRWFARNDVAYLSAVIRNALSAEDTRATALGPPRRETFGRWTAVACGALAVLTFAAAWAADVTPAREVLGQSSAIVRLAAVVESGVLAVMAVGVWQKRLFAWRLGFVVFALMWIETLFQGLGNKGLGVPPGAASLVIAVVSIGSTLVLGIWAWWWRAQRVHFESAR